MAHLVTLYKSWRYAASIGFSDICLYDMHSCSLPSSSGFCIVLWTTGSRSRKTHQSGSKSFTRGVLLPSVHHMMTACANCGACIGMKIFALHPNDCVVCYKVLPFPLLHLLQQNGFYFLVFSSTNQCIMMVFLQCLCLVGDQICPVTGQYVEKDAGSRPHFYLNKSNSILS
ncbi:hypothetical protein BDL97_07G083300 [Sphagnum fallax]|nr:hypothetical protein BDL97_07G083300 [Sphagnum fallax]